ncbi:MAG: hypothetical protein ACJ77Z_09385 [Thermoleophilaceae bacterium]
MPQDEHGDDSDEPKLYLQSGVAPAVEMSSHRRAGRHEHADGDQGPPAEATGNPAQLSAVTRASSNRDDRDGKHQLASDEEGHRQDLDPTNGEPGNRSPRGRDQLDAE